jgi:hypothetical protein
VSDQAQSILGAQIHPFTVRFTRQADFIRDNRHRVLVQKML